jgi:hypothetical protein
MSTLEVIALRILALEVANASGGTKRKVHGIGDIGCLGLGPNMAIIAFVHAVHGFGLCIKGRDTNRGGGRTSHYHQSEGAGNSPLQFAKCYNLAS